MTVALERELEAFRRELPRLLQSEGMRGKFVLIEGDKIAGVFDTVDEALNTGYERFDLKPFLVKEITDHEEPVALPPGTTCASG